MKKKLMLISLIASLTMVCVITQVSLTKPHGDIQTQGIDTTYTLTLDSADFSALNGSYINTQDINVATMDSGATFEGVSFRAVNAKKDGSGNLVLGKSGKLYNNFKVGTEKSKITELISISASFTGGSLSIQRSARKDGSLLEKKETLSSGVSFEMHEKDYFCLSSEGSEVTISSIVFTYGCESVESYIVEDFTSYWTGVAGDGITYKMYVATDVIDSSYITALNSPTSWISTTDGSLNPRIKGVSNESERALYGNDYYFCLERSDHTSFNFAFDSSLDALTLVSSPLYLMNNASSNQTITFTRLHVLNDFEGYTSTGQGYDNSNKLFGNLTGLRKDHYADWGGGGSGSLIATSGYGPMGSTDYMDLVTDQHHTGSKAMKLKVNSSQWMRYFDFANISGLPHAKGRGSTISMWVKGASVNTTMKWGAYYSTDKLTESNRNSNNSLASGVVIPANSDWTQYTVALNAAKDVTGYYIAFEKTGSSNAFVYVDDIEIYSASPYVAYVEPNRLFSMEISQEIATKGMISYVVPTITLDMGLTSFGSASASVLGEPIEINSYEVDESNVVTLNTTFSYTQSSITIAIDRITGVYHGDTSPRTISNVTFVGTGCDSYINNNGSITLTEKTMLMGFDFNTNDSLSIWQREKYDSSWVESGTSDKLSLVNESHDGSKCVKMTTWNDGNIRLVFKPAYRDGAEVTYSKIVFYVKSYSDIAMKVKVFTYQASGYDDSLMAPFYSSGNLSAVPANNGWTRITASPNGKTTLKYFGICFYTTNGSVLLDDIQVYSDSNV